MILKKDINTNNINKNNINKNNINKNNIKLIYHCLITILFVYVFIQFLTLKISNNIYKFYNDYIMNKYCLILYICLLLFIMNYDKYTSILLFILIIGPIKTSYKEYFEDDEQEQKEISTIVEKNLIGVDDRFKMDEVKKNEILRQIKAQINFDPYKTNLSKDVIYELYNKYFDNDVFIKLKEIDNKSKDYIASGKFNYIPKEDKVDFDIKTYENLLKNTSIGVNQMYDVNKSL